MNPPSQPQGRDTHGAHSEPAPDEVRTPTWLTATGIGLFVLAGVGWLMTRPPPLTIEQMRDAEAAPAASTAPAAEAPGTIARPAQPPAPKASGAGQDRPPPPNMRNPIRPLPAGIKGK